MHWLLPLTLILLVALMLAAIHFAFMRWMTLQPEPASIPDDLPADRSLDDSRN